MCCFGFSADIGQRAPRCETMASAAAGRSAARKGLDGPLWVKVNGRTRRVKLTRHTVTGKVSPVLSMKASVEAFCPLSLDQSCGEHGFQQSGDLSLFSLETEREKSCSVSYRFDNFPFNDETTCWRLQLNVGCSFASESDKADTDKAKRLGFFVSTGVEGWLEVTRRSTQTFPMRLLPCNFSCTARQTAV